MSESEAHRAADDHGHHQNRPAFGRHRGDGGGGDVRAVMFGRVRDARDLQMCGMVATIMLVARGVVAGRP